MAVIKKSSSRNFTFEGQNDNGQIRSGGNQQDYIQRLLAALNGDGLSQLLAQLGIDVGQMNAGETQDWNKQIMDTLLQRMLQNEQRSYNKDVLNEQRIYDSPTNQLARLMGAGISRDAALQLLGGSGSGSGSGSALIGDPMQLPASAISGTQSDLNAVQKDTAIANTVFNAVSCFSGLVSLGFSVPQAVAQTALLKNQAYLSSLDINAINSAADAFSILNAAGATAEAFGSTASAIAEISRLAQNGDQNAMQFIQSGGIEKMRRNSPLVSARLGSLYKSERSSADYSREYDATMRKLEAAASLDEISYDKVVSEILNNEAMFEQIFAQTDFINTNRELLLKQADVLVEQAELLRKQQKNTEADTLLKKAEALRANAEATKIGFENQQTQAFLEGVGGVTGDKHTGLDLITTSRLQSLYQDVKILSKTNNEKYFNAKAQEILSDADNFTALNLLRTARSQADLKWSQDNPTLARFGWAIEDCGLGAYMDSDVRGHVDVKGVPFETQAHAEFKELLRRNKREDKRRK